MLSGTSIVIMGHGDIHVSRVMMLLHPNKNRGRVRGRNVTVELRCTVKPKKLLEMNVNHVPLRETIHTKRYVKWRTENR